MTQSRMFPVITKTWNPVFGCNHNCIYCWARRFAKRMKCEKCREFKPHLHEERLSQKFSPTDFVFVSDMGDLFGSWVPDEWIQSVKEAIKKQPITARFLFLTKNPRRYLDPIPGGWLSEQVIYGATIESNRDWHVSKAPSPFERIKAMRGLYERLSFLSYHQIMLSIEPIMDFDEEIFPSHIRKIRPDFIYVGYDNYGCGLPEPTLEKTQRLISELRTFTTVECKTMRERHAIASGSLSSFMKVK